MNIVITSLSDNINIAFTQFDANMPYDIDDIKLFIANSLTPGKITLTSRQHTISIQAQEDSSLKKDNFNGYRFATIYPSVIEDKYTFAIEINGISYAGPQSITLNERPLLADEHAVTLITGRRIGAINTTIVAGDWNSQQLTFYIKRKYDGISFIDNAKQVYFDFIPVNRQDLTQQVINTDTGETETKTFDFLSSKTVTIAPLVLPPVGQSGEWMEVKWNVPFLAMKTAGKVRFALSVVGEQYIWQTEPSLLTIVEGIGPRNIETAIEDGDTATIGELYAALADIENLLGYEPIA